MRRNRFNYFRKMEFQDHFSAQSAIYAQSRPIYPNELYEWLAAITPYNDTCWDCATGNGQAAVGLARYFKQIIATDASSNQISNAVACKNIQYKVALAEKSGLPNASVDLITVATAAHWFNHELFYNEAKRVLRTNGILAVWAYGEAKISPEIDEIMNWFMYDFLYSYWPDARWYVRNRYENLPFPFELLEAPPFSSRLSFNKHHWLNYIRSWSAYNSFIRKNGTDPIEHLLPHLDKVWSSDQTDLKPIEWPLYLKCARLNVY